MTAERLAGQREATLAGFAAALAATGEISEMLTTAAREIAAATHAERGDHRAVVKRRQLRRHRMAAGGRRRERLRGGDRGA